MTLDVIDAPAMNARIACLTTQDAPLHPSRRGPVRRLLMRLMAASGALRPARLRRSPSPLLAREG